MNNLSKESKRWDLINYLIERYDCKSYLEIGVQYGVSIGEVRCDFKAGVEPRPIFNMDQVGADVIYKMTSDKFFEKWVDAGYDIAFIDGYHEEFQVLRDIRNCLNYVNKVIVLHDCNPPNEENESFSAYNSCGTVWRAMYRIIQAYPKSFVLDMDYGCGVIILPDYDELSTREYRTEQLDTWVNLLNTIIEWIDSGQSDPMAVYSNLEKDRSIIRLTDPVELDRLLDKLHE